MSKEAFLPCFKCGKVLENVFQDADNQPWKGTEFRTEGHYGSTFWDSFDGEELVLNICDRCLREYRERLGQQKVYLPVRCEGMAGFGRQWVYRPLVAYTGHLDRSELAVEIEDLGADDLHVEWVSDIEDRRRDLEGNC